MWICSSAGWKCISTVKRNRILRRSETIWILSVWQPFEWKWTKTIEYIQRMKKNKFSELSIILSIICIIAVIIVNFKIANQYFLSDGKTKALFGLIELTTFYYKYYFVILGILSLILGLLGIKKKELKLTYLIALSLSVLSIILVFIRLWKLMIWDKNKWKNYDRITHAYVHRLADVHLAGFAPAFSLSLCDSEYARKPPVPVASGVTCKLWRNNT